MGLSTLKSGKVLQINLFKVASHQEFKNSAKKLYAKVVHQSTECLTFFLNRLEHIVLRYSRRPFHWCLSIYIFVTEANRPMQRMDEALFRRYLNILEVPEQLSRAPTASLLYLLAHRHLVTLPYQNIELYRGDPPTGLEVLIVFL